MAVIQFSNPFVLEPLVFSLHFAVQTPDLWPRHPNVGAFSLPWADGWASRSLNSQRDSAALSAVGRCVRSGRGDKRSDWEADGTEGLKPPVKLPGHRRGPLDLSFNFELVLKA